MCARGGRQGPGKSQFKSAARELEVRLKTIIPAYVRVELLGGGCGHLHCPKLGCRLGKVRRTSAGPGPGATSQGGHESGGQQG